MKILGIDPGGARTGMVVRDGRDPLDHALVSRGESLDEYLLAVIAALDELDRCHVCQVVALEDVVQPNPHLGMTNVSGLLDTAQVVGAVRVHLCGEVVMVRPNRHGRPPKALEDLPSGPGRTNMLSAWLRSSYPAELVGPRETTGTGKSPMQDLRAAWDVAGSHEARTSLSVQQRFGITT